MDITQIINLTLVGLVVLILILLVCYIIITMRSKQKENDKDYDKKLSEEKNKEVKAGTSTSNYMTKGSLYEFMEFDDIKDNMIIRKNRQQYVMVVRCRGINYDLMSEEEKTSVEAGFVQFLNTLRFPIQLYVQTSSLNLKDITEEYKSRIRNIQKEINRLDINIKEAQRAGNQEKTNKLMFEKRRKENVLEYGTDISDYISRLSMNRNVLQQRTYLVISYFSAELGNTENLSKEELDSMCFSELYTRTQTAIRSLSTCGVIGKILSSEELAELLYVAYNRDESEQMRLSDALDAEYDALYSISKDVTLKRQEAIDEAIEKEAVDLATQSITAADKKIKETIARRKDIVKEKALEIIEEYKADMSEELYDETKNEIIKKDESKNEPTKRGRKKVS